MTLRLSQPVDHAAADLVEHARARVGFEALRVEFGLARRSLNAERSGGFPGAEVWFRVADGMAAPLSSER